MFVKELSLVFSEAFVSRPCALLKILLISHLTHKKNYEMSDFDNGRFPHTVA